jgi:hypothetical protein
VRFLYPDDGANPLQRLQPPDSGRKGTAHWKYNAGCSFGCFHSMKVSPVATTDTADKSQPLQYVKPKVKPVLGRVLSTSMQNNAESRLGGYITGNGASSMDSRKVNTTGVVEFSLGNIPDSMAVNDESKNTNERLFPLPRGDSSCEVIFDSDDVCQQLSEDYLLAYQPPLLKPGDESFRR